MQLCNAWVGNICQHLMEGLFCNLEILMANPNGGNENESVNNVKKNLTILTADNMPPNFLLVKK